MPKYQVDVQLSVSFTIDTDDEELSEVLKSDEIDPTDLRALRDWINGHDPNDLLGDFNDGQVDTIDRVAVSPQK